MRHMKSDSIEQSINHIKSLLKEKKSLLKEKAEIEKRLAEINGVLAQFDELRQLDIEAPPSPTAEGKKPRKPKPRSSTSVKRVRNKLSLRKAVLQVTEKEPLTKAEIMDAVVKLGYQFSSEKPMGSLNSVLYGRNLFRREGGKFSPISKSS